MPPRRHFDATSAQPRAFTYAWGHPCDGEGGCGYEGGHVAVAFFQKTSLSLTLLLTLAFRPSATCKHESLPSISLT